MVLTVAVAACAGAGLVLAVLGVRRLRHRKLLSGSLEGLIGLLLLALAALAGAVTANLLTYHRLTRELPVAEIRFEGRGPQHYQAHLTRAGPAAAIFDLHGDEWQLDARILKWHGMATVLGLDTVYRLERLSGRYRDVRQEREGTRSVYSLSRERGLDVWSLARRYRLWLPWVDAVYGSATYLPMADGAAYRVTAAPTGLLARPVNDAARTAVGAWR